MYIVIIHVARNPLFFFEKIPYLVLIVLMPSAILVQKRACNLQGNYPAGCSKNIFSIPSLADISQY